MWKMATAKNELLLLRTFRLALPAALLATLLWTLEFGDSTRQWIYNGLGANANNIVFIIGLVLDGGLYRFMGVYGRKILYEHRHTRLASEPAVEATQPFLLCPTSIHRLSTVPPSTDI